LIDEAVIHSVARATRTTIVILSRSRGCAAPTTDEKRVSL